MPFTHCQIFIDDAGTTPFTFPAGTVSAKVKCVGRGAVGDVQNGGGGGGYGEKTFIPNLGTNFYSISFEGEGADFKETIGDQVVFGAKAAGINGGGIDVFNIGDVTNLGGNGGSWSSGTGGCGGGGAGGPDGAGEAGEVNFGGSGGSGGASNADTVFDLTDGIGDVRVMLGGGSFGGYGGDGGGSGQDGFPGISPGGGGGGQGDSAPSGPGTGAGGVVVILYTLASFVPKVIII